MGLIIRPSKIHATGCYTTTPIAEGTFIVEYTGPRLTAEEAEARYGDQEETYLFGLDDGKHVIDGFGEAAFINHSCDPNCETDEIEGRVWIIAARDIAAGEELTYDYNLYDGELDDDQPCLCGAASYRGTLWGEEELARRAKLAERVAS
jgi:SET domain-containing protein